jgi:hypothetical protein
MATILGMLKRFTALDTDAVIQASVSETADLYANLNTEQMHKGLNKQGDPIGQYKSEAYAELKFIQNPIPGFGVVDLKRTGDFYAGIKTAVTRDKVITKSSDPKNDMLEKKYGLVFGLSDPYRREYLNEGLRPAFKARIFAGTGLMMRP